MYTPYGHVDRPLSNLAQRYTFEGAVARRLCPIVKVPAETGKYPIFGNEEMFVQSDIIGDRTEANEVKWYVAWGYYQCVARALRGFIPGRLLKGAEPAVQPRATTTRKVKAGLDLLREVRLNALLTATVGTTGQDSGDQSDAWATASTGTPLADLTAWKRAFKSSTGRAPNVVVIPDQVVTKMVVTAEWQDQVKYVQAGRIENFDELPGKICGMVPVVPSQQYAAELITTAFDPATMPTLADIWGDHVFLMWVNPRPSLFDASACYELQFLPETVRRYPKPELGIGGGEYIQAEYMGTQKTINGYLVYRGQNVI